MSTDLDKLVADLEYAAGAGSAQLTAGALSAAKAQAQTGAALRSPGPGLLQLQNRSHSASTSVESSQVPVGEAADRLAQQLADGGADLAVGKRR